MKNVTEIRGYNALIACDPETNLFRGEFQGLHGGADFYAADVKALKREGETSLKVFLDMCREDGLEPVWDAAFGCLSSILIVCLLSVAYWSAHDLK